MVNFESGLWSLLGQVPAEEFEVEDNGLGDNFRKYIDTIETNILSKHQNFEENFNDTEETENKDLYGQHKNDKKQARKTSTNSAVNSSVLLLPQSKTTSSQPQANGNKVLNQFPEEKNVLSKYFHSTKANQHQKMAANASKMIPSINPGTDIYMIEERDGSNTYQDLRSKDHKVEYFPSSVVNITHEQKKQFFNDKENSHNYLSEKVAGDSGKTNSILLKATTVNDLLKDIIAEVNNKPSGKQKEAVFNKRNIKTLHEISEALNSNATADSSLKVAHEHLRQIFNHAKNLTSVRKHEKIFTQRPKNGAIAYNTSHHNIVVIYRPIFISKDKNSSVFSRGNHRLASRYFNDNFSKAKPLSSILFDKLKSKIDERNNEKFSENIVPYDILRKIKESLIISRN